MLAVCAYPVSADVQIDESVFKITAFSGVITSPDGESASFNSISDFKKALRDAYYCRIKSRITRGSDMFEPGLSGLPKEKRW